MKKRLLLMLVSVMLIPLGLAAQTIAVKGNVKDAAGEPVIGATIRVVGQTTIGTATDVDGYFTLNVPANAKELEVSYIGMVAQTLPIVKGEPMSIVLKEDSELLDEVVMVGYGTVRKSDLTGSVASVRADDIKTLSTPDAAAALQGKAAGIQIVNTSGAPGAAAAIRVRGYSSNSGSIDPLLIVDGLKVDNIKYLDPSMIESIEILKDGASAAIYGAQAGNGVVLITTKTGTGNEHGLNITYAGKAILQSLGKTAELFNAADYIEYQKHIDNLSDALLKEYGYDGTDTNWYNEVFQPSWSQQHSLTFQGGNDKGHFFTSINYVKDNGIVVGDKDSYQRLTAQINADYKIKKWFKLSTNNSIETNYQKSVSAGYGSALNAVVSIDPLTPAYYSRIEDTPIAMQNAYKEGKAIPRDPNHNNDFYGTSKYLVDATGNPLFQRDKSDSYSKAVNLRGNLAANFMPAKWFTFTSRLGYRIAYSNSHSYSAPYWLTAKAFDDNYSISANTNTSIYYQWENFANFNKKFDKHEVTGMIGMSYTESNYDNSRISSTGEDILTSYEPNFRYIDYLKTDAPRTVSNAPGKTTQLSYFGRVGYTYDGRYSIQANFRADAYDSSKLSTKNRWGYFPSVSGGWTISNESFFKDNISPDAVSFLKLRGSWGVNGNINVLNNYQYSTSISLNSSQYQNDPASGTGAPAYGSMPSGLANPDLKWETSEQVDAGLDARFLSNRLTFSMDWYKKTTRDLLVTISPLPEIGVSSQIVNAGSVLNTGLEFEIGYKDHVGDFTYSINANASTLKNEVLEVSSLLNRITNKPVSGLNSRLVTAFEAGYPIWYFRGYKYAGVNQETGAPQYYTKDGEITESLSDNDLQYLGEGIPSFTYGITINLAYKGFDFVFFGSGAAGNEIYNLMVNADASQANSLNVYWKNAWSNPSVDKATAKYPNMHQVSNDWWFYSSSACVFDGSYFKIKQLQLGYTLPRNVTRKFFVENLRFYVSLDDYFTFTKYPGADPETASYNASSARGVDSGSYPTTKKAVFGATLTF